MLEIILNDIETRILGSLMEKEMATPEYYPLTLNSLMNACNQKSSREPVVNYEEETVHKGLLSLKEKQLVYQNVFGRVFKYFQTFSTSLKLINAESAILCILMLRGPQTIGEIKIRTERLHKFNSMEELNNTLTDLEADEYIKRASKGPGQKECRYIQLFTPLSEKVETVHESVGYEPDKIEDQGLVVLKEEMSKLRSELEEFKKEFYDFKNSF